MELHEKIKINGIEVDCKIDMGTPYTVLKKDILEKAGARPVRKILAKFADGHERMVNAYIESIEITGCKLPPIMIVEGNNNLLGHQVLQMMGAIIDEEKGKVKYRICPSSILKM